MDSIAQLFMICPPILCIERFYSVWVPSIQLLTIDHGTNGDSFNRENGDERMGWNEVQGGAFR